MLAEVGGKGDVCNKSPTPGLYRTREEEGSFVAVHLSNPAEVQP